MSQILFFKLFDIILHANTFARHLICFLIGGNQSDDSMEYQDKYANCQLFLICPEKIRFRTKASSLGQERFFP